MRTASYNESDVSSPCRGGHPHRTPEHPAKMLLVSWVGYPSSINSMLPDNGLANLAGALLENGNDVRVLDYGLASTMDRLVPDTYKKKLSRLWDSITDRIAEKKAPLYTDILKLKIIDFILDRHRRGEAKKAGREICAFIEKEHIDAVGMKLWNGDATTDSMIIAGIIKSEYPSMPVFAGGPQADLYGELLLARCGSFDALSVAEGERTIVGLAEYVAGLKSISDVDNLIVRDGRGFYRTPLKRVDDLDMLPCPVYDPGIYPALEGNQKIKMFVIDESRGCPNMCKFCAHPPKSGTVMRTKNASRVVDEMEILHKKFGARAFRMAGSSTPPGLMNRIAADILGRGLRFRYTTFGRTRTAREYDFDLLYRSGVKAVFYGMESGSQQVLDSLGKKVKVQDIRYAVEEAKKSGIFTVASIIYPTPYDSEETGRETLDLLLSIRPDSVPLQFTGLYPGTPWWDDPEGNNIQLLYGKARVLNKLMEYKIKLLFPPRFWAPLPYKINNKSFKSFSRETEKMSKALESKNIMTSLPDDMYLMSLYLNLPPGDFIASMRKAFFSGDARLVAETVTKINDASLL